MPVFGKNTHFGHFTYFSHIFRFLGIFEDILAIYILKCFSNICFQILPISITKLEGSGLSLVETFEILDETYEKIQKIHGKKGKQVQAKLDYVLGKNQGEKVLREFANIIKGEQGNIPNGWSASDVADMNYAPVQSVDVKKSFSIYKNILTERRHSLTEENLGKMMVCNCYYNRK